MQDGLNEFDQGRGIVLRGASHAGCAGDSLIRHEYLGKMSGLGWGVLKKKLREGKCPLFDRGVGAVLCACASVWVAEP